jgi:HSP20 family protein
MFIVPITRDTQHLSRLFDDTLERFFGPVASTGSASAADSGTPRRPALDVAESERAYTVKLDMPGVAKEDVKVSVEGRQVNVQAQTLPQVQPAEDKQEGERVVYRERTPASYARSFTLPLEVDLGEAAAKLEHGVLTLTLPKRGARSAAHLTVN